MSDKKIKNVIFFGRKPGASSAFEYLISKNINVRLVVTKKEDGYKKTLDKTAKKFKTPVYYNDKEVYRLIETKNNLVDDIDIVISYLFWGKIKTPLINLGKKGCINFHPAPLPDYKGRAGYNTAILDRRKDFGVSVHFIDSEKFDCGPIIKVLKFSIDNEKENAFSLEKKTQKKLLELFKITIDLFLREDIIKTQENKGGLFLDKKELENLKKINLNNDSLEDINRKIRAFFFPPYTGAKITIKNHEFTLVNDEILKFIDNLLKR